MPKAVQPMTGPAELFTRMTARGCERAEILKAVFDVDLSTITDSEEDKKRIHRCDQQMTRWRKHPDFLAIWKDEVKHILVRSAGRAYRRLSNQVDDEQAWLANKAANDLINSARAVIFGEDEKVVTVQVTGMPEIGNPEQNESDSKNDG